MNRQRRLKERLEKLAGPVDRQGVWESIEERATQSSPARSKVRRSRSFERGARPRRVRLAMYAAVALVAIAGVTVGTTMGLGGGLVVYGTDDGRQGYWEKLGPVDVQRSQVWTLLMDPEDHDILYCSSRDGIFKSTDGAETWERILSPEQVGPYSIALVPGAPATLLVGLPWGSISPNGTQTPRLMKSYDGGGTWAEIMPFTGFAGSGSEIQEIQFCNDDEIKSGTIIRTWAGPIDGLPWEWQSTDQGLTWTTFDNADSARLNDSVGPTFTDYRYSSDWGLPKDASGNVLGSPTCAVIDPDDPSLVYAGTTKGVCRSTDGGDTWEHASEGIVQEAGMNLAIDPVVPSTMYCDTQEGIFKSEDDGATWRQIFRASDLDDDTRTDDYLPYRGDDWSWVLAPSLPSTLYAWASDGLFRSEDGGQTWSKRRGDFLPAADHENLDAIETELVAVAPDDPQIVFALVLLWSGDGYSRNLYRSVDGGDSWAIVLEDFGYDGLMADSNDPSILYTVKAEEGDYLDQRIGTTLVIVKSVDAGATWQTVMEVGVGGATFCVALGVGDPTPLYVSISGESSGYEPGLWRSLDGGVSWDKVESTGLPGPIVQMVYDGRQSGVLYGLSQELMHTAEVGYFDYKLHRSTDGGVTWVTAFESMPRGCTWVTIGPGQDASLYANGFGSLYRWVPAD